jgi:hypothetical protein
MASWPNGSSSAVLINVMYETWDPSTSPKIGPMGNPLPNGLFDHQASSWAAYGQKTGIWHLLDTLSQLDVTATVYASGSLAEVAPDTIRAIVDGGHGLAAHSWSQDVMHPALTEHQEREIILHCRHALHEAAGVYPQGWMSPRCTPSGVTMQILAESQYSWSGDVFDADLPYTRTFGNRSIVAFPFNMELNDLPQTIRYGDHISALFDRYRLETSAPQSQGSLSYTDLTLHAHIGGRPNGCHVLERIVADARDRGVWIASREMALQALA